MSGSANPSAGGSALPGCDDLARLQGRYRDLRQEHELARARLARTAPAEADGLRAAWRDYCEVIAELDEAIAALRQLRAAPG
jgi:hypothetical protein